MVEPCRTCAKHQINKPEPLCPSPFPERPWQVLETDLFYSQSVDYLLVVDYFSQFVAVAALRKNKTVTEVIRALKAIFARNGIPEKLDPTTDCLLTALTTHILLQNGDSK